MCKDARFESIDFLKPPINSISSFRAIIIVVCIIGGVNYEIGYFKASLIFLNMKWPTSHFHQLAGQIWKNWDCFWKGWYSVLSNWSDFGVSVNPIPTRKNGWVGRLCPRYEKPHDISELTPPKVHNIRFLSRFCFVKRGE